jgi:hypothetical protein
MLVVLRESAWISRMDMTCHAQATPRHAKRPVAAWLYLYGLRPLSICSHLTAEIERREKYQQYFKEAAEFV